MRLSVIFATRANEFALPHVKRILQCLYQQTFQDFQVIIVCDKKFEDEQDFNAFYQEIVGDNKRFEKVQFFTHLNSDFVPSNNNGSYVRNFGIKAVDTELIQLFDEDNAFDSQYLERAVTLYDSFKQQEQTEVVICSTMLYRDTNQIQNQGFSYFSYWQSRPKVNFL
jgi:glycosyltransferase involved in cell wall biosynthesis